MTLTDVQQRQLDQVSGAEMDRRAARAAFPNLTQVKADIDRLLQAERLAKAEAASAPSWDKPLASAAEGGDLRAVPEGFYKPKTS